MVEIEDNAESQVKHFNFDRMYEYLGNDKETIKEILLMVLNDLKSAIKKFEFFIFNERLDGINDTAHKLVGTTASVGLDRLCTIVRKLEQHKKFDSMVLNQDLSTFRLETNLVKKLINSYLLDK